MFGHRFRVHPHPKPINPDESNLRAGLKICGLKTLILSQKFRLYWLSSWAWGVEVLARGQLQCYTDLYPSQDKWCKKEEVRTLGTRPCNTSKGQTFLPHNHVRQQYSYSILLKKKKKKSSMGDMAVWSNKKSWLINSNRTSIIYEPSVNPIVIKVKLQFSTSWKRSLHLTRTIVANSRNLPLWCVHLYDYLWPCLAISKSYQKPVQSSMRDKFSRCLVWVRLVDGHLTLPVSGSFTGMVSLSTWTAWLRPFELSLPEARWPAREHGRLLWRFFLRQYVHGYQSSYFSVFLSFPLFLSLRHLVSLLFYRLLPLPLPAFFLFLSPL